MGLCHGHHFELLHLFSLRNHVWSICLVWQTDLNPTIPMNPILMVAMKKQSVREVNKNSEFKTLVVVLNPIVAKLI